MKKEKKKDNGTISFRPSKRNPDLLDNLAILAKRGNRTLNNYIETVLKKDVDDNLEK